MGRNLGVNHVFCTNRGRSLSGPRAALHLNPGLTHILAVGVRVERTVCLQFESLD